MDPRLDAVPREQRAGRGSGVNGEHRLALVLLGGLVLVSLGILGYILVSALTA